MSNAAETQSTGKGGRGGGREMPAAYAKKTLVSWTATELSRIRTRILFPASILPKKTAFLFLTQEERMLYKQGLLEPKRLDLLPTQTTQDLAPGGLIPGCLTKSLQVQKVIRFQLLSASWLWGRINPGCRLAVPSLFSCLSASLRTRS